MWSSFDVILVDQVSVVIPLLKLKKSTKVWLPSLCEFLSDGAIIVVYEYSFFSGCILLSFSRFVAGSTHNSSKEDLQETH